MIAALQLLFCATVLSLVAPPAGAQRAVADVPVVPAARPLDPVDLERWLDGLVPYALQEADIAGAVITVVENGEVVLQKGYGHADIERQTPMDPERTIIEVASVSKAFTWTAVMQLVEQGKLDLDRDISEYLDRRISSEFGKPITLRHLMTHTAGFEERLKGYPVGDRGPRSLAEYLQEVPIPALIDPPGAVQAYSNYGTVVAGYLVERVSGVPFGEYVEQRILKPLGMLRSTVVRPIPESLRADLGRTYETASSAEVHPPDEPELVADPAGSLVTTAADMSRFMRAHLRGGEPVLKRETTALMHTTQYVPVPGSAGTALGLFRADYNGHRILVHDGDGGGDHTDMQLLIDDGVGFFSHVNSDGPGSVLSAAYGFRAALAHAFMDRYFPAPPESDEPTTATAREHARLVAGEYEMSRRPSGDFLEALYLFARVPIKAHDDGTLETPSLLNIEHKRPQRWREVAPFVWREVGGRGRMSMKMDGDRVVSALPHELATFELIPVPITRSATLHLPLLSVAILVVLAATACWPIAAGVRWRYGRSSEPLRLFRFATLSGAAYVVTWAAVILFGAAAALDISLDPWIRLAQVLGLICAAGTGAAVVHVWRSWRVAGNWASKAWGILVALALLEITWFSFTFSLISAELNY